MEASQDKPSYVSFEVRDVEDRDATIEAGHYVGKDVIYAIITPQGSKDRVERIATEWLNQNKDMVRQGRFPQEWQDSYERRYKAFVEGRELPEEGTPILTWPPISASQQRAILEANVRTVEDLANANEQTLLAIGMGARALQSKAKAWLDTAQDIGKVASRLEKLEQLISDYETRDKLKDEQIKTLQSQIKVVEKA